MLKFYLLSMVILISNRMFSQAITVSVGPIFTLTNATPAVINGKEDFSNTDYMFSFSYEQFFKDKRYSIVSSYSRFGGCTLALFEEGGWIGTDGGSVLGYGFCAGVNINRFDLGITYSLLNKKKKFYLKPFLMAGIQVSAKTGWEFWRDAEPVNGPNYFELEPMNAESLNTTQVVPSMGIRTGIVLWKRLDIGLCFQGVYGYKPYQKMYLKYQYKGVEQPTAEYEATGTGLFVTVGVGYRFAKLIK